MAKKDEAPKEASAYATGPDDIGKPVGPEHDQSFSAPDFYDPQSGERIGTDWDSEAQKNMPAQPPVKDEAASGGEGGETTAPKSTSTSS